MSLYDEHDEAVSRSIIWISPGRRVDMVAIIISMCINPHPIHGLKISYKDKSDDCALLPDM